MNQAQVHQLGLDLRRLAGAQSHYEKDLCQLHVEFAKLEERNVQLQDKVAELEARVEEDANLAKKLTVLEQHVKSMDKRNESHYQRLVETSTGGNHMSIPGIGI